MSKSKKLFPVTVSGFEHLYEYRRVVPIYHVYYFETEKDALSFEDEFNQSHMFAKALYLLTPKYKNYD